MARKKKSKESGSISIDKKEIVENTTKAKSTSSKKEVVKNGLVSLESPSQKEVDALKKEIDSLKNDNSNLQKELELSGGKIEVLTEEGKKMSTAYNQVKTKIVKMEEVEKSLSSKVKALKGNLSGVEVEKASSFNGVIKSHGDKIHTFSSDSIGRA